jgi:hypothetical protein
VIRPTRAAAALLAAGILALGAAGCGDDDDDPVDITVPTTTSVPEVTTPTVPQETTTTTPTTAGPTGKQVDPAAPDSQTNDVPPPPGSPQAEFEKACEKNPAVCG